MSVSNWIKTFGHGHALKTGLNYHDRAGKTAGRNENFGSAATKTESGENRTGVPWVHPALGEAAERASHGKCVTCGKAL